ncbi:MAG: hypothetical protein AB1762_22195, partial [Gemmatimonadota bacterium]
MGAKKSRGSSQIAAARAYFAQQREGGDRDLVLSEPTVALGVPLDSSASSSVGTVNANDWRAALRAVDAAPADKTRVARPRAALPATPEPVAVPPMRPIERDAPRAPATTSAKRAWHVDCSLDDLPKGLTIGSSSRDMFEGRTGFATLGEIERAVASCK